MLIGYDLNGTLCKTGVDGTESLQQIWKKESYAKKLRDIPNKDNTVIISGRPLIDYEATLFWVNNNYGAIPIYLNPNPDPYNQVAVLWHKKEMIDYLGIEIFYDDSEFICENLKKLCPRCKIIKVDSEATLKMEKPF